MKRLASHSFPDFRVTVESSLDPLAGIWPAGSRRSNARHLPFQCAEVIRIWCDTIGKARGVEPFFVSAADVAGNPWMLLPLGIDASAGVRVLTFLDFGIIDYNAPVLFPELPQHRDFACELWQRIVEALPPFDVAVLEKMPSMVGDLPNPLVAVSTADHPESGHAVTLTGPWDDFARSRLPSWKDSRRCLRKLEKLGTVSFEIARTEDERAVFLQTLFRQKRRWFAETEAVDIFAGPGVEDFYTQTTRRMHECGTVLSGLKLNGDLLAVNWGFVVGDRYFDLMTSYEAGEFRSYAPGRLLNEWLLSWCMDNGIRISDFGIGDEPYKLRYCDIHIPLRDAHIPVTPRGAVYDKLFRTQKVAKQMLRGTRVGTALKAARNRLHRIMPGGSPGSTVPAWIAAVGTASMASMALDA